MKKETQVRRDEIKIVGLTVRTNNAQEANFETGKMFPCIRRYFHENIADLIPHRKNPGTTFCIYTDYESDHNGDYAYIIGEEVESFDQEMANDLISHTIAPQTYTKFTSGPGCMPDVVREPWFKIWNMSPEELGGKRGYLADFEIYDERAKDHNHMTLDIFIGVRT